MKNFSESELLEFATFFVESKSTLRKTAKHFGISKSTLHNLFLNMLNQISPSLFFDVKKLLSKNKAEKHIRGGLATKKKFKNKKQA